MSEKLDPSQIIQMGMGFFASKTLLSAVELGLFSFLADQPKTRSEIESKLELHKRASTDFLDALVSLGMLKREGDGDKSKYSNTAETKCFLDRKSPMYIGGMLEMASARLYRHWSDLTEGLRTGKPQNEIKSSKNNEDLFAALYSNPAKLEGFLGAVPRHRRRRPESCRRFSRGPVRSGNRSYEGPERCPARATRGRENPIRPCGDGTHPPARTPSGVPSRSRPKHIRRGD